MSKRNKIRKQKGRKWKQNDGAYFMCSTAMLTRVYLNHDGLRSHRNFGAVSLIIYFYERHSESQYERKLLKATKFTMHQ